MKPRFVIVMLLILALAVPAAMLAQQSQASKQSGSKVLMIIREGYPADIDLTLKMEVGVMNLLLTQAGFHVDMASTSGQPIVGSTKTIKVLRLSQINVGDYSGIIMPCMAVGWFPGPPVSPQAIEIVKKALADGKPVAAALAASSLLAEAGLLKGKRYAYIWDPLKTNEKWKLTDARYEGGIYSGDGVVQDGKIITSGVCPVPASVLGKQDDTVQLTKAFIAAIGPR